MCPVVIIVCDVNRQDIFLYWTMLWLLFYASPCMKMWAHYLC